VTSASWVWDKAPVDERFGAYLSHKQQIWWQHFLRIFLRINVSKTVNKYYKNVNSDALLSVLLIAVHL